MTDRTESKVRQWATKRNGDALEVHDVIELVLAVDDDAVKRSEELSLAVKANHAATEDVKAQVTAVASDLAVHLDEATVRDKSIDELARKYDEHLNVFTPPIVARLIRLEDATNSCPAVVQAAIETEHASRHAEHMATFHKPRREDDDADEDHRAERSNVGATALTLTDITNRRVWVMWGVGLFAAASAASAVIRWGVSALLAHIH
jgi:hypothetical protein